jgi:hypothetical protein
VASRLCLPLRHALLHLPSLVRDDARHPLDRHQLPAVVHLVLLETRGFASSEAVLCSRWVKFTRVMSIMIQL